MLDAARPGPEEQTSQRHQTEETHMSATTEPSPATAVRAFHVDVPDEALEDLRRRIASVRWP